MLLCLPCKWSECAVGVLASSSLPLLKPHLTAFFVSLISLPLWAPTLQNQYGFLQFFDYYSPLSSSTVFQMRLCNMLACLTAVMGLFRIPKNAPSSRKLSFRAMADALLSVSFVMDSNATGRLSNFTFDVFTKWGTSLYILIVGNAMIGILRAIHDAMTGSTKQRDTIPLMESRLLAILFYSAGFFATFPILGPLMAVLPGRAAFDQVAPQFFAMGYENDMIVGLTASNVFVALGAFFASLRYEQKIGKWTSRLLTGLMLLVFSVQPFLNTINMSARAALDPTIVAPFVSVITGSLQKYRVRELVLVSYLFTILNGMRVRAKRQMKD